MKNFKVNQYMQTNNQPLWSAEFITYGLLLYIDTLMIGDCSIRVSQVTCFSSNNEAIKYNCTVHLNS